MRKLTLFILGVLFSISAIAQQSIMVNAARPVVGGVVAGGGDTEMLTNGAFTGGTSWIASDGAGIWLLQGDSAVYNDTDNAPLEQTDAQMVSSITANTNYTIEFDISISSGTALIWFMTSSNNVFGSQDTYANGHHSINVTSPADVGTMGFKIAGYIGSTTTWGIDNVSLKPR